MNARKIYPVAHQSRWEYRLAAVTRSGAFVRESAKRFKSARAARAALARHRSFGVVIPATARVVEVES